VGRVPWTHTDDEPETGVDALLQQARRRARRRMGIAACVLAAAVGAAIFFGVRGGGGHSAQPQGHSSAPISGRSAPPQGGSSGLVALTRVDAGQSHIMLVDPSGRSRPRDLGPGWGASWSPDGRKLVFTYEVSTDATDASGAGALVGRGLGGGLERIFVMNADGSGRHLLPMPWLSSSRFEDSGPAWSPDGSRIAFTRTVWPPEAPHDEWSGQSTVYVLDRAQGGPRRLSPPPGMNSGYVTWSPDGRLAYLAAAGRCSDDLLHITNADGTGDHVIAASMFRRTPRNPYGCKQFVTPAWSPDGRWIAFVRLIKISPAEADLYLISPNGKHLHRLTHRPNLINVAPTWSADGKRIAFEVGLGDSGIPHQLAVIDRDGSNRHTILHVRGDLYGRGPAWQPR
jgi:Tol biopolymer transport system component